MLWSHILELGAIEVNADAVEAGRIGDLEGDGSERRARHADRSIPAERVSVVGEEDAMVLLAVCVGGGEARVDADDNGGEQRRRATLGPQALQVVDAECVEAEECGECGGIVSA